MSGKVVGWAFQQNDLTPPEKLVLVAYADNADDEGRCWPTKEAIQRKTGLGRATVYRAVGGLEKKGKMGTVTEATQQGTMRITRLLVESQSGTEGPGGSLRAGRRGSQSGTGSIRREPSKEPSKNRIVTAHDAPLCSLLISLMKQNGVKRVPDEIPVKWADAERLLLTRDGRSPREAEKLLRWCQADEFWRSNILSMPKFRERYDQLLLQAQRKPGAAKKAARVSGRVQELLARSRGEAA